MDWRKGIRNGKARLAPVSSSTGESTGSSWAILGDHKFCRDGVWELRIDVGPGYRAYYAIAGTQLVLLFCGGDKRTQDADIDRACENWLDWQRRSER